MRYDAGKVFVTITRSPSGKQALMTLKFKKCSVENCDGNAHRVADGKRGWCSTHYQRWRKHGDPLITHQFDAPTLDWLRSHIGYVGDGCLEWPFHVATKDGYGRVHEPGTGKLMTASRLMCVLAHGEPPSARHEAAHNCGKGNQACVHPKHVYWATPEQNQNDRVAHGTSNRGERQWNSTLTADDVREIRRLAADGVARADISRKLNIHQSHVSKVVSRQRWAWLD